MTTAGKKKLITTNAALWITGMLLHPLSHLVPTSSGDPPKIMPLLITILFLVLAVASSQLMSAAAGKTSDE